MYFWSCSCLLNLCQFLLCLNTLKPWNFASLLHKSSLKGTFVNLSVKVNSISFKGLSLRLFYAYYLIPYRSQPAKQTRLLYRSSTREHSTSIRHRGRLSTKMLKLCIIEMQKTLFAFSNLVFLWKYLRAIYLVSS